MAYSKAKPYQRVTYKGATDPSYDRYLKDAVNAGKAENVRESELEKPYNVKTYSQMQQEYNPVTPPTIDPGAGTGGLDCIWTNTDCEQLVGCWAGSDILLEGPEAATAGYQPSNILSGAIVKETIGGSESRGIDFILDYTVDRNTFEVIFKDALGNLHKQLIDITCAAIPPVVTTIEVNSAQYSCSLNDYVLYDSTNVFGYSIAEGGYYNLFIRFADINIAQGTTITSARIEARSSAYSGGDSVTCEIAIQNSVNSLVFSPSEDMSLRPWTGATSWNVVPFAYGGQINTPYLTTLVQDILNNASWVANNDMCFRYTTVSSLDGNLVYPGGNVLVITI